MSTRPGVTKSPETSTVLKASAGSMRGRTAAILPAAMATSRTAFVPLRGSMTCPPRRTRSYFGAAARTGPAPPRTRSRAMARPRFVATGSGSSPPGRPAAAQVLAHVEGAAQLTARELSGEGVVERVAVLLAVRAPEPDGVAVDRPREVPGVEGPPVRPVDVVAALTQGQGVARAAGRVLDAHVPLAAEIGRRGGGRLGGLATRVREERVEPVRHDLLLALRHHVGVDRDPGLGGV